MSRYSSIEIARSESFGMQSLYDIIQVYIESAHMKLRLTTWPMRTAFFLSYETCWRFWSAPVSWNSFQRWQQ